MIAHVVEAVGSPLRARTEVGLPRVGDHPEQRAWDLAITGEAKRTGMEFEARLYDAQNQVRRHNLKRQDDPVDSFVLVVADTERNREALRLYPDVFSDLPRLRSADVLKALRAGKHPPTGYMLLRLRPTKGTDDAQDDGASD